MSLEYAPRGLVGLLTPQANTTVEPEFGILMPAGFAHLNARLVSPAPAIEERLIEYFEVAAATARQFANAPVSTLALACTGASYLAGREREAALLASLAGEFGVPAFTAASAVVDALHVLGARRIALASPYPATLTKASVGYWHSQGFEVVDVASATADPTQFHPIYSLGADAAGALLSDLEDAGAQIMTKVQPPAAPGGRILASPLAKSIAKEKGINLAQVIGSGDNGRIVQRDVENFQPGAAAVPATVVPAAPAAPAAVPQPTPAAAPEAAPAAQPQPQAAPTAPAASAGTYTDTPVSQMRKVIAKRLSESLFTAPHFYLTMEINMDKAIEARVRLNELSPIKLSFNDLVLKSAAVALRRHPVVNSSWLGDKIRQNHVINIGVAVAVDEGLLVPVIRNADQKGLAVALAGVERQHAFAN